MNPLTRAARRHMLRRLLFQHTRPLKPAPHQLMLRLLTHLGGRNPADDSPHQIKTIGPARLHSREVEQALDLVLQRINAGTLTVDQGEDLLIRSMEVPGTFSDLVIGQVKP